MADETGTEDENKTYPPARTVALVMSALYISMFLVSLVSIHGFEQSKKP